MIAFKTSARREIAARGYTIVLNMGDQQSDLAGGYALAAAALKSGTHGARIVTKAGKS